MFFSIAWRNAKRSRSENLIYFLTMVTAIATFYIVLSLGEQDVMRFLSELESDAVDRLLTKLLPTVYHKALQPKTTVTGKETGQETSKKAKKKSSEMEL